MIGRLEKLLEGCRTTVQFYQHCLQHGSKFSTKDLQMFMQACSILEHEFGDTKRHTGDPVLTHALAVGVIPMSYLGIIDVNMIIGGLLHDLVEDRPWTVGDLIREFNPTVAFYVDSLTRRKRPDHVDPQVHMGIYYAQIRQAGIECEILKVGDGTHNNMTPWGSIEKREDKIRETLTHTLSMASDIGVLWEELLIVCARNQEENRRMRREQMRMKET